MKTKAHEEKFQSFLMLLNSLATEYKSMTDAQKQFIETTVGAALFYLPTSKKVHWTGQISEEAVATGTSIKEHLYPRRWSARQLLINVPATIEQLIDICDSKYLCYTYTTAAENNRLKEFQKVETFVSPETSYDKAGIRLVAGR